MTDSRFSNEVNSIEELLAVLDVDDIGDVEATLLAFYPTVDVVQFYEPGDPVDVDVEVIAWGATHGIGTDFAFPVSMLEITRSCVDAVCQLARDDGVSDDEVPDVWAMSDLDLVAALQRALGMVRLASLLGPDD